MTDYSQASTSKNLLNHFTCSRINRIKDVEVKRIHYENNSKSKISSYCYSDTEDFMTDSSGAYEGNFKLKKNVLDINTQNIENITSDDGLMNCSNEKDNIVEDGDVEVRRCHNSKKLFTCVVPGCGRKFMTDYLKSHQKQHNDEPEIHERGISAHTIPETSKNDNDKETKTSKDHKKFYCNVAGCNKSFSSKTKINKHLVTHSDERPFECGIDGCKKNYKRLDHLKYHQQSIHLNPKKDERPFECGINDCKKNYKRLDHLKYHQQTIHLNPDVRPFECRIDGCEKSYKRSDHLRVHQRTIHLIPKKADRSPPRDEGLITNLSSG